MSHNTSSSSDVEEDKVAQDVQDRETTIVVAPAQNLNLLSVQRPHRRMSESSSSSSDRLGDRLSSSLNSHRENRLSNMIQDSVPHPPPENEEDQNTGSLFRDMDNRFASSLIFSALDFHRRVQNQAANNNLISESESDNEEDIIEEDKVVEPEEDHKYADEAKDEVSDEDEVKNEADDDSIEPSEKLKLLSRIKESMLIDCSICFEKIHSETAAMCKECLVTFGHKRCAERWLEDHSRCPLCKKWMTIDGLKSNCVYLNHMSMIDKMIDDTKSDSKERVDTCNVHNRNSDTYCINCQVPICSKCFIDKTHNDHETQLLSVLFKQRERKLKQEYAKVEKLNTNIKECHEKLKKFDDFDLDQKKSELRKKVVKIVKDRIDLFLNEFEDLHLDAFSFKKKAKKIMKELDIDLIKNKMDLALKSNSLNDLSTVTSEIEGYLMNSRRASFDNYVAEIDKYVKPDVSIEEMVFKQMAKKVKKTKFELE